MKGLASCFILILLLFGSCVHPAKKRRTASNKRRSATKVQKVVTSKLPAERHDDTLLVIGKAAVSFWLDSSATEKLRKKIGDDDFETGADDYSYYAYLADSVLKSHHIATVDADSCRYIKFMQTSGAMTVIKEDTSQFLSNLYFFDPDRPPYFVLTTDIESEYKKFFITGSKNNK